MKRIADAILYAAECHADQVRKDGKTPYINHPLQVMHHLVHLANCDDDELLCAAILHDVIEDTGVRKIELEKRYTKRISDLVVELTDDKTLSKTERKLMQIEQAHSLSYDARLIRISDKICNVNDIHTAPPLNWSIAQRLNYITWSLAVVERIRGTNTELENYFDTVVKRAWDSLSRRNPEVA
jgi:guanosine-3',5'-bis(diphosphate) 3'-pyrophosphohydrolase